MPRYRVFAEVTSRVYLDVEAESPEVAWNIANETDGGEFIDSDDGDFIMGDLSEIQLVDDEEEEGEEE